MTTSKPLKTREMILFGLGDLFGGGAQVAIAFFYLRFLTDVVQISPALAGTVVLISKIWDAVSDPMMGMITDNTRTKYGRRKPFFLIGFFGIISAYILLWFPVDFQSVNAKFAYVLFSYLYFSTVSTMVMVPYASMSSEITTDYKQRNNVNGIRLFFSQVSSLLSAVLPLVIVDMSGDIRSGWIAMAVTFALFYALPYIFMFFHTHERVPITAEKSTFSLKSFIRPFQVRAFRLLVIMYLFAFLSMDVVSTVFQYYMYYYIKRKEETDLVIGTMLIAQIVLIPAVVALSNKYGKSKVYGYSIVIWLVGVLLLALYQASWPVWMIYVIAAIVGAGVVGCVVMPWSMFPDVTDVGELKFGYRIAGAFGGVMTFMRKFSAAIGIFLVGLILQFAGYVPPLKEMQDGKLTEVLQEQTGSVILALQLIVLIFPLILLIPAFLVSRKYPLDKDTHNKLRHHLEFVRGEITEDNLTEDELNDIRKKLI